MKKTVAFLMSAAAIVLCACGGGSVGPGESTHIAESSAFAEDSRTAQSPNHSEASLPEEGSDFRESESPGEAPALPEIPDSGGKLTSVALTDQRVFGTGPVRDKSRDRNPGRAAALGSDGSDWLGSFKSEFGIDRYDNYFSAGPSSGRVFFRVDVAANGAPRIETAFLREIDGVSVLNVVIDCDIDRELSDSFGYSLFFSADVSGAGSSLLPECRVLYYREPDGKAAVDEIGSARTVFQSAELDADSDGAAERFSIAPYESKYADAFTLYRTDASGFTLGKTFLLTSGSHFVRLPESGECVIRAGNDCYEIVESGGSFSLVTAGASGSEYAFELTVNGWTKPHAAANHPKMANPLAIELAGLESDIVFERFYKDALLRYCGFDGLTFQAWEIDRRFDENGFAAVLDPPTYEACVADLRASFCKEIVDRIIASGSFVDRGGTAYVREDVRGTNIDWIETTYSIDYVSDDLSKMYLTLVCYCRLTESAGPLRPEDVPPSARYYGSQTLELTRDGDRWVFDTFVMPDEAVWGDRRLI